MAIVQFEVWKSFIEKYPEAHILQTGEWGQLKSHFGWNPCWVIHGQSGCQVLFKKLPLGFTIGYIPRGPVGELEFQAWNEVFQLCKEKRCIVLKVEPDDWESKVATKTFESAGWLSETPSIQPRRTLLVDITGDEEQILARMKQKTRYNIRLAEKKEVVISRTDDVLMFHKLMQATGERDQFGIHNLEYYRKAYQYFGQTGKCVLLIASYHDKPLAGIMVFIQGKRAWYFYGASCNEERNRMPTYLLQWEAMKTARQAGCTEYDLWGVPDHDEETLEKDFENRSDGLWGVYRFKRGFGGTLARSAGSFEKVFSPQLFYLYKVLTKIRGHSE